jgi:hypothetical protein
MYALDALQGLKSAGDALRNAAIADVVAVVLWRGTVTVLTGHNHSEGLFGMGGRGTQKGMVAHIADVVIPIIIRWLV